MSKKITELTDLNATPATGDWLVVVDISASETKKVTHQKAVRDLLLITEVQSAPNYSYYMGNGAAVPSGYSNMIYGYHAGGSITTGVENTVFGAIAGDAAGNVSYCDFFGAAAGYNCTGNYNTFLGNSAGYSNTSGTTNCCMGYAAGFYNATGSKNVAIGTAALQGVTGNDFSQNTAVGYNAGLVVTTGSNNTLLGYQCGNNITSGSNNIIIGHDIDPASATGSNQFMLGNATYPFLKGDMANYQLAINGASGYLNFNTTLGSGGYGLRDNAGVMEYKDSGGAWTTLVSLSDKSLKENIEDSDLGIEFIRKLKPKTFNFIKKPEKEEIGLVAQDVEETLDELNIKFPGWWVRPDGLQQLKYEALIMPLINAVKTQDRQIRRLKHRVRDLENHLRPTVQE